MDPEREQRFLEQLDECHDWPCAYTFKFIVAADQADEVCALLGGCEPAKRPSRTGKYVSVTAEPVMQSAQEVLEVYRKAAGIPGIVSL